MRTGSSVYRWMDVVGVSIGLDIGRGGGGRGGRGGDGS